MFQINHKGNAVAREDAKIFTRLFDNNNEEMTFSLLIN